MNNPKVSIVVPVYNVEKYLVRCVESILAQTYRHFELLLVDDGSTDASGRLCDRLALTDSRIKVLHKENGGVSSARNLGLDNADGEWVCFCDSDDVVQPKYLGSMVNAIVADSSLVMASYRREDGLTFKLEEGTVWHGNMVRRFFEQKWIAVSAPYAKLYNRSILETHSIRFPVDIHMGEDAIFILDYINVVEAITALNACHYFVRSVSGSLSSRYYPFESEWKCYVMWRKGLLDFANRYGAVFENPLQKVWEARTGEAFTRCLQSLYKCRCQESIKKRIRHLRHITKSDFQEYKNYFHPCKKSQCLFKFIIVNHLFPFFICLNEIRQNIVMLLHSKRRRYVIK